MSMSTVSSDQIIALIDEIVSEMPHIRNPSIAGSCKYQKRNPEGDENPRCIVGEVAYRLGWDMPPESYSSTPIRCKVDFGWPISEETATLLNRIQRRFDGNGDLETLPAPPWGEAWEVCKSSIGIAVIQSAMA